VRILIADDDPVSRRLLVAAAGAPGHEIVVVADGTEACGSLEGEDSPSLAILDWIMPGLSGVEVCRRVRARQVPNPPYLILVTSRERREDVTAGFAAGADDYIVKPFDPAELRARVTAGLRIVGLQQNLADRLAALEEALARVQALQGLLPICAWCKRIRDDRNYWQQVEGYIADHSGARFSQSTCPECRETRVTPEVERLRPPREI
jgi:DNA-binding response OmpR family regulator